MEKFARSYKTSLILSCYVIQRTLSLMKNVLYRLYLPAQSFQYVILKKILLKKNKFLSKEFVIRSTKISYFQVLIMLSMSSLLSLAGVLPSGATKSSESSPFASPQIPSKLPISKTEGIIWRCWIQSLYTLYFTEVPEGRVIYDK